jgi:hypothetical protein
VAGFDHVADTSLAVIRWFAANRIDYVLVGPVARALRGDTNASGPVAIVPAPYGRNLDRLARALASAHAQLRRAPAGPLPGTDRSAPLKLTAETLLGAERWALRCGSHDLDVEGHAPGRPRYQELLYEASRVAIDTGLAVEVASPEHIEHFDQSRLTGATPEIRVRRAARTPELL